MESFCSYFNQGQCRSCKWIELDYSNQLEQKEQQIREALDFFPPFVLEKSVRSPTQAFRNRAKMVVTGSVENPIIGLAGEVRLDEGRQLLACPIHHWRLNEVIASMPGYIQQFNLIPYRIQERTGELKGLIAFYSPITDQMYLRFILRSKECIARIKKMIPALQLQFPALVCISANIQPIPHAILEGPEEVILTEKGVIDHQIGSIRLKLAPQAFVQTNLHVAAELYQAAADWISEAHPGKVLELFCGQGAFSFFAAKSAAQFLGIEINSDAVRSAHESAQALGLTHLRFKSSDATRVEAEIVEFQPDLILANPPRRGLADGIKMIQQYLPKQFLYSSCAIETLASDLKKLSSDYRLRKVQLFDMFPHTSHFETLVWIER